MSFIVAPIIFRCGNFLLVLGGQIFTRVTRMTPEEKEIIFNRIRLSGLMIQDYVAQSCMYNQISVVGNIKTFDAIRNEMKTIDEHLMSLKSVDELEVEKLERGMRT